MKTKFLIYFLAVMSLFSFPVCASLDTVQVNADALVGDPSNSAAQSPQAAAAPGAVGSPAGAPTPANMDASTAGLPDYTNKLMLRNDLSLCYPVSHSCDQHCKPLPDHNMVIAMEGKSDAAFSFKWSFTDPINAEGVRAVDRADVLKSHKVSFFYANSQRNTLVGYTNAVRLSDELFRQIKAGQAAEFETDGPYSPMVNHKETVPLPKYLKAVGKETLPVMVDEKRVSVRVIQAQANNGWTYSILDNPKFPILLKGTGPFVWEPPIFVYANGLAGDNSGMREGKRIVKDLANKGIATTNAIQFDFDSAKLRPSAKPILSELAKYLAANPAVKIEVQGHTCTIGSASYNMSLSDRRAKAVRDYLVNAGIDSSRLQPIGFGFNKPVASNATNAGREKNRRVVFRVTAK